MHNTRTQGITTFLFGFLLALSQIFLLALLLTRYALYLFLAGLPVFSKGGWINDTERCFDLYSCAVEICSTSNITFTPHDNNCHENRTSYEERMPGWMEFEYAKIYTTVMQATIFAALTAFFFLAFPFLSWLLARCGVRPLRLRVISRFLCAILILCNIINCVVIPNSVLELDKYKPIMAAWTNDLLLVTYRLSTACIWIQSLGCSLLLIYNQVTQIHPDIDEFRPLLPGDVVNNETQSDTGWGRIERGNNPKKETFSDTDVD